MDIDKGGYIYISNNKLCMFIYKKLNTYELNKALPISAIEGIPIDHNYIVAHFIDGIDYIGHATIDSIETDINNNNMLNISLPYNILKNKFEILDNSSYTNAYNFLNNQLRN